MPPKKATKPKAMKWKKISDWVYETKDPVTGGIWRYVGKRETSELQMYQAILFYLGLYGRPRPEKGKFVQLAQPAAD